MGAVQIRIIVLLQRGDQCKFKLGVFFLEGWYISGYLVMVVDENWGKNNHADGNIYWHLFIYKQTDKN